MKNIPKRVSPFRFAPSPTGDMHIGNLRVALISYILAKQTDNDFVVRIEDTDTERNVPNGADNILDALLLCGMSPDRVYRQSDMSYSDAISKLPKYCMDSMIPVPNSMVRYNDVLRGKVSARPKDMQEFRYIREDGRVLYNFACAVDDIRLGSSLIVRGEDHLSNTTKQVAIKNLLEAEEVNYLHLPIIKDVNGSKLSKRDNSSSVMYLINEGYLPVSIVNYLLGMGYDHNHEIYTLNESIDSYDVTKISKNQPTFDINTLKYYNREHLKAMSDLDLFTTVTSSLRCEVDINQNKVVKYLRLFIGQYSRVTELAVVLKFIRPDTPMIRSPLEQLCVAVLKTHSHLPWKEFLKEVKHATGLKGKELYTTLRKAMTGLSEGPELTEVYETLYKTEEGIK